MQGRAPLFIALKFMAPAGNDTAAVPDTPGNRPGNRPEMLIICGKISQLQHHRSVMPGQMKAGQGGPAAEDFCPHPVFFQNHIFHHQDL